MNKLEPRESVVVDREPFEELLRICRQYLAWRDRALDRECLAAIEQQMRAIIAKAEGR